MQASILVVLFAFFSATCAEQLVSTQYWDPNYPFEIATCANRNESIMVHQLRVDSYCYDGTDMPWTQVSNPKARKYSCTDDGNLMYQECAPFQYTGSTSCRVNCSAPVAAGVDSECYHGVRLNVISCERGAPTFTGTYFKKSNPFGLGPTSSAIMGAQTCEDAYGPHLIGYGCNITHYWELNNCQYACTNCVAGAVYALTSPNVCINSKVISCYKGYVSNVSAIVPTVTQTVNSDTVCARFDYKCHIGDCTCSKTQQNQATCKRGHDFISISDCMTYAQSTGTSANVLCCGTNQCNAPSPSLTPCVVPPTPAPTSPPAPSPVILFDEIVAVGWQAQYSAGVWLNDGAASYTGVYSISYTNLNNKPYVHFRCVGCVSTVSGYSAVTFYAKRQGSSTTEVTVYVVGPSNVNIQTIPITTVWKKYTVLLPAGVWDGVGFASYSSVFFGGTAYLDTITLL